MDSRGQVSVEYLLLLLVILIILGSVTIPLIGSSIEASTDVSSVSDAKTAVESIANAADVVYSNGPGSVRTVNVYIPQNTNLVTRGNNIGMNITYSQGTKFVNSTTYYTFNNTSASVTNRWYKVTVRWVVGTNNIGITVVPL
ncbi:MAG: class III signal peptide-containing protein [Methanobacteriaceae archaeon]